MTATPLTLILLVAALIYRDHAFTLLSLATGLEGSAFLYRWATIKQYEAEAQALEEQRVAEMASRN